MSEDAQDQVELHVLYAAVKKRVRYRQVGRVEGKT